MMNPSSRWPMARPAVEVASAQIGRGVIWKLSTKSGQSSTTPGGKVSRLTNRMRRLARSHPEAVAQVSPAAVEASRAKYAAVKQRMKEAMQLASALAIIVLCDRSCIITPQHLVERVEAPAEWYEGMITGPGHVYYCGLRKDLTLGNDVAVCLLVSKQAGTHASVSKEETPKKWRNADFSTPEFFEWLNSYPRDMAERLAENEDEDEEDSGDEDDSYVGQDGSLNIGKTFLLPRSRVSRHDGDIFTPSLLDARDKILEARSPAQLRLAHDHLRGTEAGLHEKAGNYSKVAVGFEEPAPSGGSSTEERGPRGGQGGKRGRAAGSGTRVIYGPAETFAYVYHRMIPAYTVVHRALTELKEELPDLNPRSMLDFGSGPGTAALAVWDAWGGAGGEVERDDGAKTWDEGSKLEEVRLVEESQAMRDAGKTMLGPLAENGRVRVGFGRSLLEEARAASRGGGGGTAGGKKFDLVVAAYSLSHLSTHASRAAATAIMWSLVAPGGALVIVEDGTAKGSHTVRSARKMVLRSLDPDEEENKLNNGRRRSQRAEEEPRPPPYVVGPCRHDKECPLPTGEFCRFSQKVPWNAVNVTKSAIKGVAFSYVTIRKGPPASRDVRETTSSSVDLLKAFAAQRADGGSLAGAMDDLGTDGISDARLKRQDWARLIRKPLKAKRHALLDVCTPDGNVQRKIISRGKWKGAPGVFTAARKSELGGLWPYLDDQNAKDYSVLKRMESGGHSEGEGDLDGDDSEGANNWGMHSTNEAGPRWEAGDADDAGAAMGSRGGRLAGARRERRRGRDGQQGEVVFEEGW